MGSVYPGALDSLASDFSDSTVMEGVHPEHHNDLADAANSIEAELGVNPSGSAASVAERLAQLEQDMVDRIAEHGFAVQRFDSTTISASQWVPLYGCLTPCKVRDVALVPRTGFGGTPTVYWEGRLAISRYWNSNPVPVAAPVDGAIAGIDVLATRRADGSGNGNAITAGQLWRFGSVVWNDADAEMTVGDVLGVWWEKVGAPINLTATMLYSMRMAGVGA